MLRLDLKSKDINSYLKSDNVIDHQNKLVSSLAKQLKGTDLPESLSNIFYYMRDVIKHSVDAKEKEVITISASEVLDKQHGLCMAKAHLFAALCRSIDIPAGFCYQTLIQPSLRFVHGLNAVYYAETGEWYRIDIVGDRTHAQVYFESHRELLFYTPTRKLTIIEHAGIYSEPHPSVMTFLRSYTDLSEALEHLPEELDESVGR